MIYQAHPDQSGFTAVELLVTLIIASMFLFAGYQLYTQVQRDGADANRAASVSGLIVNRLQVKSREISGNCVESLESSLTVTEAGIGPVTYKTTVKCPNSTLLPTLKLIKIEGVYQTNPDRSVTHATYAE